MPRPWSGNAINHPSSHSIFANMTRSVHEREKRNNIWKGERERVENKKRFLYLFLFYWWTLHVQKCFIDNLVQIYNTMPTKYCPPWVKVYNAYMLKVSLPDVELSKFIRVFIQSGQYLLRERFVPPQKGTTHTMIHFHLGSTLIS